MQRREFVKYLAALCAGAAALPLQLEVFEQYYEANTPLSAGPFVALDEVYLSGLAWTATPFALDIFNGNSNIPVLPVAFNAFGGIVRWTAMPDQKIVIERKKLKWKIRHFQNISVDDQWLRDRMQGHISYICDDKVRRNTQLLTFEGGI